MMLEEKKRKVRLAIFGIAVVISLFALYMFIFVYDNDIKWKIGLIIIGFGWLISAIFGIKENVKKK